MSRPRLLGLLLAFLTLLVYLPVLHNGFVNFDDQDYVSDNPMVQKGLTWAGIKWAFTTVSVTRHSSYWHPITWLSHMVDCELFGLNPGAHHFVNALLHAANAVLLFVLLLRLTDFRHGAEAGSLSPPAGELWPSIFVATLFALHPLRVESVAWISERKDVLSVFFGLLTLLAYTIYAKENCRRCFWFAIAFFALSLMSKPMLVTLPFVMMLLDYWPLQRMTDGWWRVSNVFRLALGKWPFFLLTALSCMVTFIAQRNIEAVMPLDQYPLNLRFANALISYGQYLAKTIWPWPLAIFYPLPNHLSWIRAMAPTALAALGVISWLIWRTSRQCPCLLVGWLWFLGTLVPVIGLVQVGGVAMADRFSYFPLVGIYIAVAFGVRDLVAKFQFLKTAVACAAVMVLAACLALTENQLRYWRDSETLFAHALAVTKENYVAHVNFGVMLEERGELNQALAEYRAAEQIAPELYHIHYNIGNLLNKLGHPNEALVEYHKAMLLSPGLPSLHNSTGVVLAELGRFDQALGEFKVAVRLDPAYALAHFEIGKLRLKQGRDAEAIDEFRVTLRIDSNNIQILAYTAYVLAAIDNPEVRNGQTALVLAVKAKLLAGDSKPEVLDVLGMACAETGDFTNALEATQRAYDLAKAAKMNNLEPLQQRLERYKNHQPWRESFLATNPPPKEVPKN
jgi:tetratricopeptide (TPR) repeat protein